MGRIVAGIMLVALVAATASAQNLKVGVINSDAIIQTYPEFKSAEAQLQREMEGWQAERGDWEAGMESLMQTITERENRLAAGANTFSQQRKSALQAEVDSLKADYSQRLSQRSQYEQERFNNRRAELLSGIFETVNKVIEEYGDQNGFDIILDASNGTIVYARDPQDITDKILQALQNR